MKVFFRKLRRFVDRIALQRPEYRFLFEPPPADEVVTLDCETTGFDPWVDDVISVAAIRIKGNRILTSEKFEAILKPEASMRADAIKVHQLRAVDVANARPMSEVLPDLLRFIGSRPLVGYWIDFDVSMLDKYVLEQVGINLPNERIDVSQLYYDRKYARAPQGTALDLTFAAISRDLGLNELTLHDAFSDALMAGEMYVILKDMIDRDERFARVRGANYDMAVAGA